MKKIAIILGLLILIGGSVYTVYNYNKSQVSNPNNIINTESNFPDKKQNENFKNETALKVSKTKAMDFKLKDLTGKEVSLSDYKGKKVFLNFWATWCPPCKAEMPEMEMLYQETKNSDLVILAVNLDEERNTVQKFINSNKYDFPVLLDTGNIVASQYEVVSIPTSFFIDKEGNIVDKHIGAMTIEDMKNYINNIK
ncbi:TlpA disulfide reductase family protein [Clostridium sp. HMP27]|uniref:TlpA family protein disulfide reductase n=1 Tax=Clostridium sp. HMP27 TaxID=1487921 RepID=UPI00052C6D3E|nr:TlpA disulfide reductase family protein [Clostridium sp. HMP27]KGK88617.1 alkyl hydroperoxide reductase [Clostridium sp. HMP27]